MRRTRDAALAVLAVLLALACASCSTPLGKCLPPISPGNAAHSAVLGAKWDWSQFDSVKPYLRSLPQGVTYYEIVWCDIEPHPGQFDWTRTDYVMQNAAEIGFTVLAKIRVGQCWATGHQPKYTRGVKQKTESGMPKNKHLYARFVRQVVKRYSPYGVHEYAIENEVNSPSFWSGTPQQYRLLVKIGGDAIHNASPSAKVVDAGISSVAAGYGVVDRLMHQGHIHRAMAAWNSYYARRFGTRGLQVIRVHSKSELKAVLSSTDAKRDLAFTAVTNRIVQQHLVDVRQVHYYEPWNALPYLMDYLHAKTPASTPMEMWELGSYMHDSPLSAAERSAEMVKATILAIAEGISKIVWLPLKVDPQGRITAKRLYGLLRPSGRSRLTSNAYAAIADAARGAKPISISTDGVVGVGFDNGHSSTAIVWASCTSVGIPLPPGTRVNELAAHTPAQRQRSIWLDGNPVEIRLSSPISTFLKSIP